MVSEGIWNKYNNTKFTCEMSMADISRKDNIFLFIDLQLQNLINFM